MDATTRGRQKLAASLAQRAARMLDCVHHVEGHICEDCGRPAPRNGQIKGRSSNGACHARVCPRCARRRSAQLKAWGEKLKGRIAELQAWCEAHKLDYRLRLVTLTDVYDPSDEACLTVDALRRRKQGLRSAWSEILERVRRVAKLTGVYDTWEDDAGTWHRKKNQIRAAENKEHAAAIGSWSCVELAGRGHVHLHVAYFGPWVELHEHTSEDGPEPG
jgi:hypothetical protein